jgi:hypothetical protein
MKLTRIPRSPLAAMLSAALLLTLTPATSRAASLVYWVDVNTASLIGNSDAPYSLDLDLIKGVGNQGNIVTVSNVTAYNGSGVAQPLTWTSTYTSGTESGSLASSVTLTSTGATGSGTNNEYAEQLPTSGGGVSNVWFKVTETNNAETVGSGQPTPDQFSVYLDAGNGTNAGNQIATNAPDGISLVTNSLVANPFLSQVGVYTSQSPDAGAFAIISSTPEPGRPALLLLGAIGMVAQRRRKVGAQAA